ncbi:MAG: hypothetical protein CBC15_14005 [Candidatus Endolissoclinum sp. TMED55]|nr:MAG: hypothetical protein CBC15_14005 [Candidatus Endolissoclinum sp. TMED55]
MCQQPAPRPPEAGAESRRTGTLSKRGEAAVAAQQAARIGPRGKTSKARPGLEVTAGKGALRDSRPLGAAQAIKCPALDLIGGRRYQRRAESGYHKEKSYPGARRIAPRPCRRYSLFFTVNKSGFMALGTFARFSYIFR